MEHQDSTMTFGAKLTQKKLDRIKKDGSHLELTGGKFLDEQKNGKTSR